MMVELRATYGDVWWPDDEPDSDYCEEHGYTSVWNPWGGFQTSDPQPEHVTLLEAAVAVLDFPGGVWDYCEGEAECVDYREGIYRNVTLHVKEHELAVFALADMMRECPALRP